MLCILYVFIKLLIINLQRGYEVLELIFERIYIFLVFKVSIFFFKMRSIVLVLLDFCGMIGLRARSESGAVVIGDVIFTLIEQSIGLMELEFFIKIIFFLFFFVLYYVMELLCGGCVSFGFWFDLFLYFLKRLIYFLVQSSCLMYIC